MAMLFPLCHGSSKYVGGNLVQEMCIKHLLGAEHCARQWIDKSKNENIPTVQEFIVYWNLQIPKGAYIGQLSSNRSGQ